MSEIFFDNPADASTLPQSLGKFDTRTEISYNPAGNITLMESLRGPDSVQTLLDEFYYDPSGRRMLRSESHNLARHSMRVLEYNYDSRGNLVSESEKTGSYSTVFRYDGRGYPKREISTVAGEEGSTMTRYAYDRRGRLKTSRGGGPTVRYLYRPDGSLAEVRTGKDLTETYGAEGNLERSTNMVKSGKNSFPASITATYEYDRHGNWLKRIQYYEGRVISVTVRKIDYYK
jgi:hypothetical protein